MATNTNLFDNIRFRAFNGNATNFETPTGTLKMALVTSAYTPNQNTNDFWDDVSANEVSGTGYTAGGNALANPTVTLSGAGLVTVDADDPATWAQDGSGFSNARRAVIYEDSGTASTSPVVAYSDDFGQDLGNVGGDLTIALDAAGLFTSPR